MDIEQELSRMVDEMILRTGNRPAQIVCNQETLDWLWRESTRIYSSFADTENNTGYIARYNGIPITLSPEVESGRLLLAPNEDVDCPVQSNQTQATDDTLTASTVQFAGTVTEDPTTIREGYNEGDIVTYGFQRGWLSHRRFPPWLFPPER